MDARLVCALLQNRQAEAFARQLAALKAANLPEARAELLRLIDDYIMRDGGVARPPGMAAQQVRLCHRLFSN